MKDDEITEFVEKESKRLGIGEPQVLMKKMKTSFGLASLREWQITLNRSWCHKSGDIIVKQMISHELMHLRDFWIRGFSKHDKFFRDMCNFYGVYLDCRMSTKNKRNNIVKKIKEKDGKV